MATPDEMANKMRDNLLEKTGRSLEDWLKQASILNLEKHGQLVKALKSDFELTHGFANLVAHDYFNQGNSSSDHDLIAQQYSEVKSHLKSVYDRILSELKPLDELEVSPKKTYVSLRRSKQFALIQPSTKTRVDVGIQLKGVEPTDRLELSGSFNAMVTHRVRVSDVSEVDAQLIQWLKQAYELS